LGVSFFVEFYIRINCLFLSTIDGIKQPSQIDVGADYYLFRDGIKPEWEDPKNAHGGKWDIELDRKKRDANRCDYEINKLWEDVMMLAIGEQFGHGGLILIEA